MRHTRSKGGFTLIELTVASALLSIVLLLVVMLFVPALKAWTNGQRRSEVDQSLLVTTNWIGDDVVRASPTSLRMTADGALTMSCAADQRPKAENPFSERVAYWLKGGELFRASKTLADSEDPKSDLTLADIEKFPDQRRVAADVTAFEPTIEVPWRLDLHLAVDKLGRRGDIYTSVSSIYAPFDLQFAEEEAAATPAPP